MDLTRTVRALSLYDYRQSRTALMLAAPSVFGADEVEASRADECAAERAVRDAYSADALIAGRPAPSPFPGVDAVRAQTDHFVARARSGVFAFRAAV